jgi:iron(II)-dependent oxidoreductase
MVKHRQSAKVKPPAPNNTASPIIQKEVIVAIIGVIGTILIAVINKFLPSPPVPTATPIIVTITETSLPTVTSTPNISSGCRQDMAYIPEGFFWLGSENDLAFEDEAPRRRIFLDAYCIDLTEVDNREYNKFLTQTYPNRTLKPDNQLPVVNIIWENANNYCEWIGGALPSEYQWEKAAKGGNEYEYPWGNQWEENKANDNGSPDLESVESFIDGRNDFGILNMAGNAAEWTADWYDPQWYSKIEDDAYNPISPPYSADRQFKAIRGGSYIDGKELIRTSARISSQAYPPDVPFSFIGFRCVASPKP